MGKAPDKIQKIALYGSKAFSGATPSFNSNYIGNSTFEDQRIALWKRRGNNLVYLSNTNFISSGGFMGTTFTSAGKAELRVFIKKCYDQGIRIGVVGGIAYSTGPNYGDAAYNPGPALRVVDYNQGVAFDEKITNFLIEEEYWRAIAGNMNFSQFLQACSDTYDILNPAGVSNDVYIVRKSPGDLAAMAPYIDIFWMTTYLYAPRDNQARYDAIHPWVVELAGTLPSTPIKAGALISLESYEYNKTGGNDVNSNFMGYQSVGKRFTTPFTPPQPSVTSTKNFNQLADKITHNGTVGLPPIDFNSEPNSVTNYIDWQGIQVFDDDLNPNLNILDANTNEVYAFGDGSAQDAAEYVISQQVAGLVPQNAARLLYLGDVYNTGTQAEFIGTPRSFDTLYGTQSNHNLLILASATMGQREWANRAVGYDPYWSGSLAGVGTVQSQWDGDRTLTNPHYYSFYLPADDGTLWKFICLNTMEDGFANGGVTVGSPMHTWLVSELADSSVGRRKIVFCHHPRFSSDGTYGDNVNMQPVWDAMQNKAMILLSGHVHNYQRMNMRDSSGAVVQGGGVYQVISGTGGTATFGFAASYLAGAVSYRSTNNGATRLTLYNDHVDVCFIRNDGVVLDCSSLPVATTIPPIVDAGPDQSITLPATATMAGTATDTNTPSLTLTNAWTKTSGPGNVTFSNPNSLTAVATFSQAGTYVLRLTSNNGVNSSFDEMTVTVSAGPANKTLLINSTPNTGVAITVSLADVNGNQNGNTNFTRVYLLSDNPFFTAPSTVGSYVFVKWTKDGNDYSFGTTINSADALDHTYVAVYTLTPAIAYPVITNSTPVDGVVFAGTFAGASPQYGYVTGGDTLTLSAPASVGGRAFVRWTKDGTLLTTSRNTTTVISSGGTYTAEYAQIGTELDVVLYAIYGTGYFDPVTITFGTVADFAVCELDPEIVAVPQSIATVGPGTSTVIVEPDTIYTLNADDGIGNITTVSLYVPRSAMPSAHVEIAQPVISGGTGTWSIVVPGDTPPYDVPPLGQGGAAGVLYTSAALVAGSYTHTIGPSAIESAVVTNLITDGDLTTDPFALGAPWTKTGTINYGSNQLSYVGAGVLTIPVTITAGKYYWLGAWMNSGGSMELRYDATTINSGSLDEFGSGVFVGVGGVNAVEIRNTGGNSNLYRVVLFEYDITFGATLVDPDPVDATAVLTNVTCNGGANGSIALTVTGGISPYTFVWTKTGSPGNVYPDSAIITTLDAGTYNVTIYDSNGNLFSDSYFITEPSALVVNTTITNVTCNGANNGTITFGVTGGTAPYTYVVDGGITTNVTTSNIPPGRHTYIVIDNNGCTANGAFLITEPTAIAASLVVTPTSCYGVNDGTVTVTASGGTSPYTYSYDGAGYIGSNVKSSLAAGAHTVAVKDSNNCIRTFPFTVEQPTEIVVVKTFTNPTFPNASDGTITLAITGGVYPIIITWGDGTEFTLTAPGSITYDGLQEGTYTATVVDDDGCSKNVSQALTDAPDVPPVTPPSDVDVDRFSVLANCCLGDKIYEVFKAYKNGHTALECLAYPAFLLNQKVKLLRKWYTLGQTLGGAKGIFVFNVPFFANNTFNISMVGLPTVTFIASSLQTYDENMTQLLSDLTTAGYDAEYQADSGFVFIYSPMNSFYNGIPVNILVTQGGGSPVRNGVLSKNGFMGAVSPCITDEKFTPNCLSVTDKNTLIEQIRIECNSCLCGDYKIKDTL